jgi:hypothetical protein
MAGLQQRWYGALQVGLRPLLFAQFVVQRQEVSRSLSRGANAGTIPGVDTQRVLFVGEATAVGYGTHSQDLGIAAHFARQLGRSHDIGVSWSIIPFPDLTIRTSMKVLADPAVLDGVDILVVMAGIGDSIRFTPPRIWERTLQEFLTAARSRLPEHARIFVATIPPIGQSGDTPARIRKMAGAHAVELNAATDRVIAGQEGVATFPFPLDHVKDIVNPRKAHISKTYADWARMLLDVVLDTPADPGE